MLEVRNSMPKHILEKMSDIIQFRVFLLEEYNKANLVGLYYSIGSEVSTLRLINDALNRGILSLPRINASNLEFAEVKSMNDLTLGKYNIMEPKKDCKIVKPELIIVPGIVFDEYGYRIGYGKGYYDRYLLSNKCYTIGLAYDFQVLTTIPHEDNDVRINKIVTDKRILTVEEIAKH